MRQRTLRALETHLAASSRVLDLGCGPGCDAEYLAKCGHRVTAVDWSPAMVGEARRRMRDGGVDLPVHVLRLGIHELDQLAPAMFDAAVSNLGPLNCVPDVARAARLIADRLCRGGVLAASVIGRVCPWEIARFLARGDWARARIRFSPHLEPVPLNGRTVWTRYYTPSGVRTGISRSRVRARVAAHAGSVRSPSVLAGIHGAAPRPCREAPTIRGRRRRLAGNPSVGRSLPDRAPKGVTRVGAAVCVS